MSLRFVVFCAVLSSCHSGGPKAPHDDGAQALLRRLDEKNQAGAVHDILATGDPALAQAAAARIIVLAAAIDTSEWRTQHAAQLRAADAIAHLSPTEARFEKQLHTWQLEEVERLYPFLLALGTESAADFAYRRACRFDLPVSRRLRAAELADDLVASGARRRSQEIRVLSQQLHHPELGSSACTAEIRPPADSKGVSPDALELRGAPPTELESLPCDLEPTLRSTNSDAPAVIKFVNQRTESVELIWLDFDGHRKSYGFLAPGSTRDQRTFLSHPWVVSRPSGTCVDIRLPRAPHFDAVIR
jgi:hypothetical protein